MSDGWDPGLYRTFADHRLRPGVELLARLPHDGVATAVDLGCGTGELTVMLADRYPRARVTGVDGSASMLEAAPGHPRIEWVVADIAAWAGTVDVVFSNAALHWVDDHRVLLPALADRLTPGGTLAVQLPANWAEPTHTVPAEVLGDTTFAEAARGALLRDRILSPSAYHHLLSDRFADVDVWETVYHQRLEGEDPVFTWTSATVLAPVLAALAPDDRGRFTARVKDGYRRAYPQRQDGATILPFRRLFMVGRERR